MLFRLYKSLAAAGLLLSVFCAPQLRSEEPELEISYFPEVVFKGKALTCLIRSGPNQSVLVHINGKEFARLPKSSESIVEFTFFPVNSSVLSFSNDTFEREWAFQIIEPGFEYLLTENSGYLYQNELPVILLPQHILPPPLDRRWQTVGMVKDLLIDDKKSLSSIMTFFSGQGGLKQDVADLLPAAELKNIVPLESAWFRIHGYLTRTKTYSTHDFIAVELDFFDLERGMSPQTWFMKWQFFLQHLQSTTGYQDGLLFGPVYTENTRKWKAVLDTHIKSLAVAHRLRYVDRSLEKNVWQERLLNQLGKTFDLP